MEQADQLMKFFPSYRIILAGDLNQLSTQEIEDEFHLIQTVSEATRGSSIHDKILMDEILVNSYHPPVCYRSESREIRSLYHLPQSQA